MAVLVKLWPAFFGLWAAPLAAAPIKDLVNVLPGFGNITWQFRVYSGFIDVPGPINGYDALKIHYQFHTAQESSAVAPVVTWHQGGPGGSSILVGLYGEMGAFQLSASGAYLNPWAWNKVANMLYLESPAGSGGESGYSQCIKEGKAVTCEWDDVTQAEAYAHTLRAFFLAFPEFAQNDLYLTGESYFGQYGPNIAYYILNTESFQSQLKLRGMALGNACWGGNETCVACNGPSEDKVDADFFFGKGLYSPKLRERILAACNFPTAYVTCDTSTSSEVPGHAALSEDCKALLSEMHRQVGPHNVYNVYDNCPETRAFLERTGKDSLWLTRFIRNGMHDPAGTNQALLKLNGGYDWACGGAIGKWITRPDVRRALHLDSVQPGLSDFKYRLSGPAAVTLYPQLVSKLRMLIYNGDADACVPYNGNEQWVGSLEKADILRERTPWTPWFAHRQARVPAGYATSYSAPGSDKDFSFVTIRLAGHMVPQFQPEPAFAMFSTFLAGPGIAYRTWDRVTWSTKNNASGLTGSILV